MAKSDKIENNDQKTEKSSKKSAKSSYSKNSNFREIDGSLEIEQITNKIDTFINV